MRARRSSEVTRERCERFLPKERQVHNMKADVFGLA